MATISDITTTPLSGLNYIDALLDKGPDWNYLTDSKGVQATTLKYTFSVASGNEDAASTQASFTGSQVAFSASQQAWTRSALDYISKITGIQFVETTSGTDAQLHLCSVNLIGPTVTGLCSWHSTYGYSGTQLTTYDADAYVYLDNSEWAGQNANLAPGGYGYETLLHELGHALGLKHPFETTGDNNATLPASQDSTLNTLMSYNYVGSAKSTYQQDDLAALKWLYGGDGLAGAIGINSTTGARYLMGSSGADTLVGTSANDTFEGDGGNDMINGGGGNDTAVYRNARSNYDITVLPGGDLQVNDRTTGATNDGTDTLHGISTLQFSDVSVTSASILAATGTPDVPTLLVTKNANGYAAGTSPAVNGAADAGDTVKIFTSGGVQVGSAVADANGLFSIVLNAFNDGTNYQIYATATNSAGLTSAPSAVSTFNIDAHAPSVPTAAASLSSSGNVVTFNGTGEAGTTMQLIRTGATAADYIEIAETKVGADGKWSVTTSPLPNGAFQVAAVSVDLADNATSAAARMSFTSSNPNNVTGTANNDTLTIKGPNTAIDGGDGVDTLVVNGPRANYTLTHEVWGYGLTDKVGGGGHDALLNIERVQFSDNTFVALDVNGNGGEIFRLYQAAFGRAAEAEGLGYWIWRMDTGTPLIQVSHEFMTGQAEFNAQYGLNPTDNDFITHLYQNVLHRAPDAGGFTYWLNVLHNSPNARADVLIDFSESPENKALVIAAIQDGMTYTPHQT